MTIPKTMAAVVYRGPHELRLEQLPVPRSGAHDLLVRVATCGVCPTDIKKIQHGTVPPPRVFGHETAGTIVKVGALVRGFRVGERVALHHHVPCLDCHACRHRAFAQCATYKRTGITAGFEPAGGGYAEYVRVLPFVLPGVVKIPARNTFEEGAMLEPVNTVLKAVERLDLLPGDVVHVAGQGPIGLMFTRLLALRGVRVVATDLLENRLQLARRFGAQWAVPPDALERFDKSSNRPLAPQPLTRPAATLSPSDGERDGVRGKPLHAGYGIREKAVVGQGGLARRSPRAVPPFPFDAVVIAVPVDALVRQAFEQLRGGGKILLFAHTKRGAELPVDLARICVDEVDLVGSYSADFTLQKQVARLVFGRRLDVRPLITHRFPLAQTAAAVELAARPTPESLKILVSQTG